MKSFGMAVVVLTASMVTGLINTSNSYAQKCYATPVCQEMKTRAKIAGGLLDGLIEKGARRGVSEIDRTLMAAQKTRAKFACAIPCFVSETNPACFENGSENEFLDAFKSMRKTYDETINRAAAAATTAAEKIYVLELDLDSPLKDSRFANETLTEYGIRTEDIFPCEWQIVLKR